MADENEDSFEELIIGSLVEDKILASGLPSWRAEHLCSQCTYTLGEDFSSRDSDGISDSRKQIYSAFGVDWYRTHVGWAGLQLAREFGQRNVLWVRKEDQTVHQVRWPNEQHERGIWSVLGSSINHVFIRSIIRNLTLDMSVLMVDLNNGHPVATYNFSPGEHPLVVYHNKILTQIDSKSEIMLTDIRKGCHQKSLGKLYISQSNNLIRRVKFIEEEVAIVQAVGFEDDRDRLAVIVMPRLSKPVFVSDCGTGRIEWTRSKLPGGLTLFWVFEFVPTSSSRDPSVEYFLYNKARLYKLTNLNLQGIPENIVPSLTDPRVFEVVLFLRPGNFLAGIKRIATLRFPSIAE